MALVYPSDLESMLGKSIASERQPEVASCIDVAQSWIARAAGIRSLEKETTAQTVYLDGCEAYGNELWLPPEVRPAWNSGSDLMVVTEDGLTLTTSTAYSSSAGVIVRYAQTEKRGYLVRPFGWSVSGSANIAVTCKVGFDALGSSTLAVPGYVWQLIREVAYLTFLSPALTGKTSVSKAGASVSIEHELSPMALQGLNFLRGI